MDPRDDRDDEPQLVGAEPEPTADAALEAAVADPGVVPNDARSFRLFQLRIDADGSIGAGRQREQLPKQVYGRAIAVRYLTYYAKRLASDDLLVLVDVNGAVVNVAQGHTGRLRPLLRREVRKYLMKDFNVVRQPSARRTSRPASKSTARRTSRRPGKR
jgi:hypothetical protein